MKKILYFILVLSLLAISCSSTTKKIKTLRRLDEIDKAKYKVAMKNETAIDDFIDAANNGNREVRAVALWVLASNKIEKAYPSFLRISREDYDFNVRAMAVYGISQVGIKNPEGVAAVTRAMNDTDSQVQIEAIRAAGILNNEEFITPLLGSLSNKDRWIKLASIDSLKNYSDNRIDNSLNSLLKTENDPYIRSLLLQVIEYREDRSNRQP